jgi:hypothetical protein
MLAWNASRYLRVFVCRVSLGAVVFFFFFVIPAGVAFALAAIRDPRSIAEVHGRCRAVAGREPRYYNSAVWRAR